MRRRADGADVDGEALRDARPFGHLEGLRMQVGSHSRRKLERAHLALAKEGLRSAVVLDEARAVGAAARHHVGEY